MCPTALLLPLLALLPAAAEDAPPVRVPEVREVRISNGMRFLLVERHDAPIFFGQIMFHVGGVDEQANATGLAHMFEHMAFKGTRAIGTKDWAMEKPILDRIEKVGAEMTAASVKGNDPAGLEKLRAELEALHAELRGVTEQSAFAEVYSRAGERGMNAYTSKDVTAYHVSLPANQLELWMLMESERLRDPVLREFYTERDVVSEERRMRTDSSPGGLMWERLAGAAFLAHPYRTPTIGWMSDIQSLTLDEARDFYFHHYSPDNAVGVLVGDFDVPATEVMLEKWFGRIPRRGVPQPVTTVEPPQMGERRVEVRFPESSPRLMIAFHKHCAPHPDDTLADVAASLLGDGRTCRLYRRLVLKDRIASGVFAYNGYPGGRYDNLFVLGATPLKGHTPAECEAAILDELKTLASAPAAEAEMSRVRAQQEVAVMSSMASNGGLAGLLVNSQVILGDWREPWNALERLRKVRPEDVQGFAGRCFGAENRTVLTLLPKETP